MTIENCIKLSWSARAIAAIAGLALATGHINPAPNQAIALAWETPHHPRPSDAKQQHVASAPQHQASSAIRPTAHAPQQHAIRQANPTNQSHRLQVHNLCNQAIELVVRYQNPQQNWVIQDGGQIPSKTSRYLTSSSSQALGLSNKLLYYYARSLDSELIWSGRGSHQYRFEEETLNMRIHYAKLDALSDYSLFILCAADTP